MEGSTVKARRPKKAPEDLSAKYRMRLEGEERVKGRRMAGMTKARAQDPERIANDKRRKAAAQKEKDEVQRREHGGRGLGGTRRNGPPGRKTNASSSASYSRIRWDCLQQGEGQR